MPQHHDGPLPGAEAGQGGKYDGAQVGGGVRLAVVGQQGQRFDRRLPAPMSASGLVDEDVGQRGTRVGQRSVGAA